jgi:hypothetical protein
MRERPAAVSLTSRHQLSPADVTAPLIANFLARVTHLFKDGTIFSMRYALQQQAAAGSSPGAIISGLQRKDYHEP